MVKPTANPDDPRDLIGEAFRMDGLTPEDARSIFFDWALGLSADARPGEAAARLLERHGSPEGHPMTALLTEAAAGRATHGRRGGRRRRES